MIHKLSKLSHSSVTGDKNGSTKVGFDSKEANAPNISWAKL